MIKTDIFDKVEYFDLHLNATVRANVLGGGIDHTGVYLVIQPFEAQLSERWHQFPTDDTAFKVAADVVIGGQNS